MNPMAPCPPDSPLMKAWEAYQETDDFKNSYNWATAAIKYVVLPEPSDPMANRFTEDNYRQFVQGSLWAAFMQGWKVAGGADPFAASPVSDARGREALETALQEIVLTIAFLNRDLGSYRMKSTVEDLSARLARADAKIRAALSPSFDKTGGGK